MEISLNGKKLLLSSPLSLRALQEQYCPDADVFIYNGFQTDEDLPLQDGDTVVLIRRGELPSEEQLESMMAARHTPFVHERVKKAKVGIAGLGGLGSNIAVMLARTGIGELVLADFDLVEPSNLNRQHYTMKDIGIPKTLALLEQLEAINPYLNYETYTERVIPANAVRLFAGCDVVCEAFDRADQKAMLIETLLVRLPDTPIVSGSGMAGYGSANAMRIEQKFSRLYVCGDGMSDIADGIGLMAPRVAVCAAQQATMAMRLLLGEREP